MNPDDPQRIPEDFLEAAQASGPSGRGCLRVYLGMCPGVGKTYTMLEDARRRVEGGANLLVGWVDTHGRSETKALTKDLPLLPRRKLPHRDTELDAFDIDAALQSGAAIVLVDELAHTNAPGSRHPKRWQDVEELLAAGIDVWTTVNIQHVESLRDAVAGITGVRVQETVPDTFLDSADEIRVIDLMPGQLRERLAEGKVYLGERAAAAAEHFFREGNLRALREMALRFATRKVDAEKRGYMRRHRIAGPWRAGERFLVAVGPSPYSERLIRLARRLAQTHDASWVAAHIDSGQTLDEAAAQRLAANLTLARSLGGETISFSAQDTVAGILHVARRENVTQIIAGKALQDHWWTRLRGNRIADRLQRGSGEIDLLLVHPGGETPSPTAPQRLVSSVPRSGRDGLVAGGMLATVTLLGLLADPILGYRSIALFYLLAVAVAGVFIRRWAAIAMALLASLAWNFFFTDPRFTFAMMHSEDVVLLAASLVVAVVVGHLTTQLRQREIASRQSEQRSRALYQLTRVAAASTSMDEGVRAALKQIENVFPCQGSLLVSKDGGDLSQIGGPPLTGKEESVCRWALDHEEAAGRFTHTLPESGVLALPLLVNGKYSAVLALRPSDNQLASPVVRDLLGTFASHFSVMLEKEQHQQAQREASLLERSRHFQRALLDHVSHEIKTPVAVIQSASELLLRQKLAEKSQELLEEIGESSRRLNRVFTQLITLSRAEAGLVEPALELCDARDLIEEIAAPFPQDRVQVSGEDFTFQTDPAILHTVLTNLLQNAVQYGTGPCQISARRIENGVQFDVSSAGQAIPESERTRIFERFHRGASAAAGGMGLGLPIAKQFASLLDGELRLVASTAEQTRFTVTLPSPRSES